MTNTELLEVSTPNPEGSPSPYPPVEDNTVDIVFLEDLPKELTCTVCEQAFRMPYKTVCGHLFCQMCVETMALCAICGTDITAVRSKPDKATMKKVQALGVKCSWFVNGCEWTKTLKHLEEHAVKCEYRDIQCTKGCGDVYPKNLEEKHLREDCGRNKNLCDHCRQEVTQKNMEMHLKVCPSVLIDCPNNCGLQNKPREEIRTHACPNAGNACPFNEFGCAFTATGHQGLQAHVENEPIRHLTYLCDGVIELKTMLSAMQLNMEQMMRKMSILQTKSETLEKLYGASKVWKIDNFGLKLSEARNGKRPTIFSDPFSTGRYGYRMILSACLNGDGDARGQYMSLHVSIMKGDYDALLTWPFNHKITVTLVDQNPTAEESLDLDFNLQPAYTKENKAFLDRPAGERNPSFGIQKFLSLEEIDYYVKDQSMFIKVNVDTEHMKVI